MNLSRAFLTGTMVWVAIFSVFTILSFIPSLHDAETLQTIIVYLFLIPILYYGLTFYYKKGKTNNGFQLGLIIIVTCLILDALITLPLVIIPHGGDYMSFFTSPLLLIMGLEILAITFLFWSNKQKTIKIA